MSEQGESIVGIPRKALPDKLQPIEKDSSLYIPINGLSDIRAYLRQVRESKEVRRRDEAERDVEFQQLVVHNVLVKGESVFAVENAHTDQRLRNTISLGLGGHCTAEDVSLIDTFYREFAEEVSIKKDGEIIPYQDERRVQQIKEHVIIHPVGIIKDERDDVGKSHVGVVCVVTPKNEAVDFALQVENAAEERKGNYVKIQEVSDQRQRGEIQLNGWGDIVLRHVLLPRIKNVTSSTVL
jgi:predicted NUDIX family phosphoesterase